MPKFLPDHQTRLYIVLVITVRGPNSIHHLKQIPTFEWCVQQCISESGHQKYMCLKEIFQNLFSILGSKVDVLVREQVIWSLNEKDNVDLISTLMMNKIFICASKVMRKMAKWPRLDWMDILMFKLALIVQFLCYKRWLQSYLSVC